MLSRVIPVALMAFCFLSARAHVSVVDGPDNTLYGFPLFWHWDGVNSLSVVILPAALLLDVVFYVVFVWVIAWIFRIPILSDKQRSYP